MMAVDTSALMALLLGEPEADDCMAALARDGDLLLSAGTMAEALTVAARRVALAYVTWARDSIQPL